MIEPPRDEAELCARLSRLSGRTLGEIAVETGFSLPRSSLRDKGKVGQLLERALGATAASRAEPDFPHLGIELKTLPIDANGRPRESTFVSSLDLAAVDRSWERSPVRHKLQRVCWVIVQAAREIPLDERRCGAALLWSPSAEEEAKLRSDYEDIVGLLDEGARVTGHVGEVLQLRPKGRDAAALRWALDEEGAEVRAAPRAFYLRNSFTHALLKRHFV